jgi:hypothetical protein
LDLALTELFLELIEVLGEDSRTSSGFMLYCLAIFSISASTSLSSTLSFSWSSDLL